MNYALDALWWRLTDPHTRALASLLTAPALWHSGAELGVRALLGETGFRYLIDLNDKPAALHARLAAEHPFGYRLGHYAESLLAFWLDTAPHTQLLARNAAVQNNGATAGAADFIALLGGEPHHIELTCKYYGSRSGRPQDMAGLNPQDRLQSKAAKLTCQLALLQTEAGRGVLQGLGIEPQNVRAVSVVRGIGFSASGQPAGAPLNPLGWSGLYLENWHDYAFSDGLKRYRLLNRMEWLAPAREAESGTADAAEIRRVAHGLIAELEPRPDGCWHETGRIMKVSPQNHNGGVV